MCGLVLERNAGEVLAELLAHAQVHLVVHQPQRHLGDLGGEFLDLDAVELVHVQADELVHVHTLLAGRAAEHVAGAQHVQLQLAQLAVADHQEISAAAGRVEKREGAQLLVKVEQPVAVALDLLELGAQLIQKQRLMSLRMFSSLV
jgi:hypothetical protein